ncbi:hypothetical protein CHUAL_000110 [Chamberlinius hualienensis]
MSGRGRRDNQLRGQLTHKVQTTTNFKFQNLLTRLIQRMKDVDELFNRIFVQIIYTGSYYENQKIEHADEFDLNLQLDLGFDEDDFQVQHRGLPSGFANFTLLNDLDDFDVSDLFSYIFQEDQIHLSRSGINRWMQSVVDKSLANGHLPQIRVKSHGAPASTVLMNLTRNIQVSVDLVPVIYLDYIPRSCREIIRQCPIEERKSCLVPEPPPKNLPSDDSMFRISLPELEKKQLKDCGYFKPIIRIFKSIRDENGWESDFPSFFI